MNLFETPPASPIQWLQEWISEARQEGSLNEPTAMSLATLDNQNGLSSRIVLFKGLENEQIHFYTNYESRKGVQLNEKQAVALNFWWDPLMRQIRIEGYAEKLSRDKSQAYFAGRPRGSQIGAWASDQSRPIDSRGELEEKFKSAEQRFENERVVECPPHWGGYAVTIKRIEFWQGRDNRFHDRLLYNRSAPGWKIERLQP